MKEVPELVRSNSANDPLAAGTIFNTSVWETPCVFSIQVKVLDLPYDLTAALEFGCCPGSCQEQFHLELTQAGDLSADSEQVCDGANPVMRIVDMPNSLSW